MLVLQLNAECVVRITISIAPKHLVGKNVYCNKCGRTGRYFSLVLCLVRMVACSTENSKTNTHGHPPARVKPHVVPVKAL